MPFAPPRLLAVSLAYEVLPGLPAGPADGAAWSGIVATIAGWPSTEPLQPVLERRVGRSGACGTLRDVVSGQLLDPLGLACPEEVRRDVTELLRPLRRTRGLRVLRAAALARHDALELRHVAELHELDPLIPEGRHALPALFADLCAGLAALPGPVALSIVVSPAPASASDAEEDEQPPVRRVRFCLSLQAAVPLPASLRARAEALCLARRSTAASWSLGAGPPASGPLVLPGVAAVVMGLDFRADAPRLVEGRPFTGMVPSSGAVVGRVRRTSGRRADWRLPWEERRHHCFVAGASGCGKSTALLRLVLDDLDAGRMVVVLDPHGDLADEVATAAGTERVARIDPRDPLTRPLDLLDTDPALATAHLMSAISEVWPSDFAGPVWQRGMSLSLRVLAARDGAGKATLAELERYVVDREWRTAVLADLPEGRLRDEAVHEALAWNAKSSGDSSTVSWLAGKLTPLTQGPAASLFALAPELPLEETLRTGRALVVTLRVGELGSDTVRLIGRMLLSRLMTALGAQCMLPPGERRAVSVVLDEAHLVSGPALTGLFAQARKFNASVTVATQAPSQLGAQLPAVLTNVQTLLLGRLPVVEAAVLRDRAGEQALGALPTLPRHHLIVVGEDHAPALAPLVLTPAPVPATAARTG